MKSKYNNLLRYIYEYSEKMQRKETINGLFRAILEPLNQNQKVEACIFCRIFDTEDKESSIKRLTFSGGKIYNYSNISIGGDLINNEKENIWGNTEFLVVLGGRYSAALIWDYSDSEVNDCSRVCILYNSRIILEIAKLIAENSKEDLNEYIKKYSPDRRENMAMNKSIYNIVSILNEKNEEYIFSQNEKNKLEKDEDAIEMAKTVNDKAKFIAHEIKNYLSIINLYSKIANKRFENFIPQRENIDSIENALKNITNATENISYLVNDLRCLSTGIKKEIAIKKLVEDTIDLCRIKSENNGVKIYNKTQIEENVETDKVKVQCAIINIILNAIDAGAKNIEIETSQNSILIKNDGAEIPKEIQEKIFEENFTTKEKGNGLGLAFCKEELKHIGGNIQLISSNKKETVFEIKV